MSLGGVDITERVRIVGSLCAEVLPSLDCQLNLPAAQGGLGLTSLLAVAGRCR
jgi:hypothetical protein